MVTATWQRTGLISLLTLLLCPPAWGAVLLVDDDGLGSVSPGSAADCDGTDAIASEIQEAVDSAVSGDTVKVCPGDYQGPITITTPQLTITGNPAGNSFPRPPRPTITRPEVCDSQPTLDECEVAFSVTADGVQIDSFRFLGDFSVAAVILNGSSGSIIDNEFLGDLSPGGGGFAAVASGGDSGGKHLIFDNVFRNQKAVGVWIIDGDETVVSGNTFDTFLIGVEVSNADHVDVVGNTFLTSSPDDSCVHAISLARLVIEGQGGQHATIRLNEIHGLPCTGIGVEAGAVSGGTALIRSNNISSNLAGIEYGGPDVLDATHNWWGDPSGPSGGLEDPVTGEVADGAGDAIVGSNIAFDPWLSDPHTPKCGIGFELAFILAPMMALARRKHRIGSSGGRA